MSAPRSRASWAWSIASRPVTTRWPSGLAYAQELLAKRAPVRRTRDAQGLADRAAAQAAIDAARAEVAKRSRGLFSPQRIVEAVEAALALPFDEGMTRERELFLECLDSPQRAGLIHAFFAEREAARVGPGRAGRSRARSRASA